MCAEFTQIEYCQDNPTGGIQTKKGTKSWVWGD
jgi:hypothetical protein